MKWLLLLLCATTIVPRSAHAQPQELQPGEVQVGPMLEPEPPFVDLYTFGPGELIFERFGHAAICLRYHDEAKHLPLCFNFGVTDFEDEGLDLTWNFLRGKQVFWAEPTKYATLYQFYADEDRDIYRTELTALDADDRRAVEAELWRDMSEENRYYIYDHFFDNCTTRIRDIFDAVTGGKLKTNSDGRYAFSYRELGQQGLAGVPPLIALTDFVLGRQLDDHPTQYQAMFWPDVLREQMVRLGGKTTMIRTRVGGPIFPVEGAPGSTGRLAMFLVALGFTLPLIAATLARRFVRAGIAIATLYSGLWGLVIWTLVVISPIPGVRWNELVLVLVPFDLALPFLGAARQVRYARIRLAMCFLASALAGIGIFHQPIWIPLLTAVMPLSLVAWADRVGQLVGRKGVEDVVPADPGAAGHRDGEPGVA